MMVLAAGCRAIPIDRSRFVSRPGIIPVIHIPGSRVEGLMRSFRGDVREERLMGEGHIARGGHVAFFWSFFSDYRADPRARDITNDRRGVVTNSTHIAIVTIWDVFGSRDLYNDMINLYYDMIDLHSDMIDLHYDMIDLRYDMIALYHDMIDLYKDMHWTLP